MIHADFESILVPVSGAPNNPKMSSIREINVHQPSGWCMRDINKFERNNEIGVNILAVENKKTIYL